MSSIEKIEKIRHSLAHLLAYAVQELYPGTKFGIGPVIENGFYYDFDLPKKISSEDLPKIEEKIKELIKKEIDFKKKVVSIEQAKEIFKGQPFKLKLINDLETWGTTDYEELELIREKKKKAKEIKNLNLYVTENFIDLCRGGHVKNTKEINPSAFKLVKIAGAYWRGDEKNPMLTRIYGVAFETKEKLEKYLEEQKITEQYNHRVLGEKFKIFLISHYVGKGLPLLLPKGEIIKNILMSFMREKEEKYGYLYVATPHIASYKLYEKSGHLKYYQNEMYKVLDPEGEEFYLKPMNCPHHHMIYQHLVKSYRDLPLRLAEAGPVYRIEKSGETYGLMRVRGPITQNDAHIYVTKENLEEEFLKVLDLIFEVYQAIKVIKNYWFRLSLPDFSGKNKEKYGGDLKLWQWASKVISSVCQKRKINLVKGLGEAAFYGPKLDMQIKNIYGKEETLATIQADILVPKRMGLTYIDGNNEEKNPIVIHRAIIGSYERFIGFLLEHSRGHLPFWLAPEQIWLIPIASRHKKYAKEIFNELVSQDLRVKLKDENETVSKKIREGEKQKIPYLLIVGDEEEKAKSVNIRQRNNGSLGAMTLKKFLEKIKKRS
jgi:threonyl-tRNA synthetase